MSRAGTRHPLLDGCGVDHGFGQRDSLAPAGVVRPTQVHGREVARLGPEGVLDRVEADAVVSCEPGAPVAVVTADCVPILAATRDGRAVAAIHAGWKGLACGVIPAALEALARLAGDAPWVAVVGPHIGPDHYEVDGPVLDALAQAYGDALSQALEPSRPGHARLDLGQLALEALHRGGLARDRCAVLPRACTFDQADRFHSYRRDGARAGRLLHHIAAGSSPTRLDRG